MKSKRVYLDYNATTPLRREARAAMLAAMDVVGNPSSVHAEGREAKMLLERARGQVAELVGCDPQNVVFTGSATEAARTLVHSLYCEYNTIVAGVEHDAIKVHGSSELRLKVDGDGRIKLDPDFDIEILGAIPDLNVVAVQAANSETGVLQDVFSCAAYIKERKPKSRIISDLVQHIGKLPFRFDKSELEAGIVSAHKLGGPKGVGAIIVRNGFDALETEPMITGGGQEMNRRSGTENIIGIAGFGAAAQAAKRDVDAGKWEKVAQLRSILENAIAARSNRTIFVGKDAPRLPNTSCMITPGWKGETQVMQMDLAGFAISAGSACSSGKVKASTVLQAMGYDEGEASSAIRVSLGLDTTEDDVLRFVDAWAAKYEKHTQRAA